MVGWNTEHVRNALIVPWLSGQSPLWAIAEWPTLRPKVHGRLLQKPYVDYFARLNAMTAQLELAAEIHWS